MEGFAGLYALLLIPGFIWVQVYEHYLLREKKEQFVKTLEIVLWSALIWAVSLLLPLKGAKLITEYLVGSAQGVNGLPKLATHSNDLLHFFGLVCAVTFLGANLWAKMRRVRWWNSAVMGLTGRDWYPTSSQKFFAENVGRSVWVVLKDNDRTYVGTLYSAPDSAEDGHIIVKHPFVVADKIFYRMPMHPYLLLKVDHIVEIRSVLPVRNSTVPFSPIKRLWSFCVQRLPKRLPADAPVPLIDETSATSDKL